MNKTWLYLAVIVILGVLTYFVVFKKDDNVFGSDEVNFNVKDVSKITTIFLSNLQNENIKLSRKADSWILNDSVSVRLDAVQLLLEAFEKQHAQQPVALGYHDAAIRDLSSNSTKVEIYCGDDKTNSFYVSRNPGAGNVTYMLNEGAKRPYVVKLRLTENFIGARYFTNFDLWRDRKILYAPAPIEHVELSYVDSSKYNFILDKVGDQYSVKGAYTETRPLNIKRVESYLKLLDGIFCFGFENTNALKEPILQSGRKLGSIVVKRKGVAAQSLTFYFREQDKGTKATIDLGGVKYDFDSFFGWLNEKDFILLSRQTAEKMLRLFPEFYEVDQKISKP